MHSSQVLNVLKFLINFSHKELALVPIHINSKRKNESVVKYTKLKSSSIYFWQITLTFSFIGSILELFYHVNKTERNFVKILFHAFLLFAKWCGYTFVLFSNTNASSFPQFLNCLYKNKCGKEIVSKSKIKGKRHVKHGNEVFNILTVVSALGVCSFYLIFVPVVVFVMPWLHKDFYSDILGTFECSSLYFRTYLLVTQIVFVAPVWIISPIMSTCCLVTLQEISTRLQNLW